MAYDEELAQRMRETLEPQSGVTERKMFGGLAFMIKGNMAVGTMADSMMVRVGPDAYESALELEHANKTFGNFRAMKGFVFVGAEAIIDDEDLADWISKGVDFAESLPAK